jgi:putative aminopeptidase FrvX
VQELIKKLSEVWGPSGYEHHVRELIRHEIEDVADEVRVDGLGNLICRIGKGGTRIMVAAHMDEIGAMIMYAEKKTGYLRFANIGGLIKEALQGNRVRFEDGTMGVIGVHKDGGKSLDDYYIDVETPASFWRECETRGTRMVGKAMDDRIGCVVAMEAMKRLNKQTPNEVSFVFTVQEEVGLRGARAAGYGVDPHVAMALDVTRTGDEAQGEKMDVKLGGGAAIKIHDSGLVVPPAVRDWMIERAEAENIPYQLELLSRGTTDAAAVQTARSGVPSGCISIPCRFIHTVSETIDLGDVEACIALLTALVSQPTEFAS